MTKDFDSWNISKKEINLNESYLPLYKKREIRWCRLGVNIGYEQDGTGKDFSRPVLVLRGFSRNVCLVVPLTTSTKKNPYHISVGKIEGRDAFVIISQVRLIDTKRLDQHISFLNKNSFEVIRKAVRDLV